MLVVLPLVTCVLNLSVAQQVSVKISAICSSLLVKLVGEPVEPHW